jgi:hypothetical protein
MSDSNEITDMTLDEQDDIVSDIIIDTTLDEQDAILETNEEKDGRITKEFQEHVIKYIKIDDLIRKKREEIKLLTTEKKPHEEFVLKHLDNINEGIIEIDNVKLQKNKATTKVSLSHDNIKDALKEKINDPQKIQEIIDLMDDKRPVKTRTNIKRTTKNKNGKKLKN